MFIHFFIKKIKIIFQNTMEKQNKKVKLILLVKNLSLV